MDNLEESLLCSSSSSRSQEHQAIEVLNRRLQESSSQEDFQKNHQFRAYTITGQDESNARDSSICQRDDDDAISAFRNDDNSRRYYVNKLYQPLNGTQNQSNQQGDNLDEFDDEYLLYQEDLRFLETAAQELADEEKHRGQLSKILEDDDDYGLSFDDEDDANHMRHGSGEDLLDRLHMTTIIETFESFPNSPLNANDPLINGSSIDNNVCNDPDQPDSTRNNNRLDIVSPVTSSESGNCLSTTNYHSTNHNHYHLGASNRQESHHYPTIINGLNSQQDASETNYFNHHNQQVSSTFDESINKNLSSISNNYTDAPLIHQTDSNLLIQDQDKQPSKKRTSHQASTNSDDKLVKTQRVRKRRSTDIDEISSLKNKILKADNKHGPSTVNLFTTSSLNNQPNHTIQQSIKTCEFNQLKHNNSNYNKTTQYDSCESSTDSTLIEDEATSSQRGNRRLLHNSKYRRRTANARERTRMREINQAFEKLKKVVPIELIQQSMSGDESDQTSVSGRRCGTNGNKQMTNNQSESNLKLTKITTLRLAVSYISKLSEVLNQHQAETGDNSVNLSIVPSSASNNETPVANQSTSRVPDKKRNTIATTTRRRRSRCPVLVSDEKKPDHTNEMKVHLQQSNNHAGKQTFIVNSNNISAKSTSGQVNGYQSNVLVPLQQKSLSQQQQQVNYVHQSCTIQQQSMGISNNQTNQDRTFVTPVVAILGIPTNNGNQNPNEAQPLQLLGIQGTQQRIQTASLPQYNLITQHPQHVTLTLDDINGLSVLRLANSNNSQQQLQRTFQIQPQFVTHQQSQQQISATSGPTNYSTYQSVQFSQLQPSNSNNNNSDITRQLPTPIQICKSVPLSTGQNSTNVATKQTQSGTMDNDKILIKSAPLSTKAIASTTTGSSHGGCKNFSITSGSLMAHTTGNNLVQAAQFRLQQTNCTNLILQQQQTNFQQPQMMNQPNHNVPPTQANLIYISPPNSSSSSTDDINLNQIQQQMSQQQPSGNQMIENQQKIAPIEQSKFVTQFQRQDGTKRSSIADEGDISRLVASLATSIQPNNDENVAEVNQTSITGIHSATPQNRQQNQAKKTYRFHNYDGNMITNNLYNNSQQEKQHTNTNKPKNSNNRKSIQQQQQVGQRSRQNSLSSTCSTMSSSSSSLSTASPMQSMIMLSKSPSQEPDISSGSSVVLSDSQLLSNSSSGDNIVELISAN